MPSLNSAIPSTFCSRSSLSCSVLQEWSRNAPWKIQMIESWRKVPCLDLDKNNYSTCWRSYAYTIFMHTCFWWVWVPSQQPEPVRLHWLPALWLSELALPVCMESLKSMRIYVLLPQSLSYAWLAERTNTLASLEDLCLASTVPILCPIGGEDKHSGFFGIGVDWTAVECDCALLSQLSLFHFPVFLYSCLTSFSS